MPVGERSLISSIVSVGLEIPQARPYRPSPLARPIYQEETGIMLCLLGRSDVGHTLRCQ
jgi:hypothetical protein